MAWLACSIFYAYLYAMRTLPGMYVGGISASMGIEIGTAAGLIGSYMLTYGLGNLVTGGLMDKYGAKWVIPAGPIFVGVGVLMFASGHYGLAYAGRLVMGFGCAFGFVGCGYLVGSLMPPTVLALFIGLSQAFGMGGGALGAQPLASLLEAFGLNWQSGMVACGLFGLVLAVLMLVAMPAKRKDDAKTASVPFGAALWAVLKNPQAIRLGFIGAFMFTGTTVAASVLGMPFLVNLSHLDTPTAKTAVTLVSAGWVIGAPLAGYVSDRIHARKPLLFIAIAGMAAISIFVRISDVATMATELLFALGLLFGILSGSAMLTYTMAKESADNALSGTASGVQNAWVFGIGFLISTGVAELVKDVATDPATHKLISVHQFQQATLPILLGLGVAALLLSFTKETASK
ncbi:MFS transporter [Jeongeupia sp. HS-3]|nr:MFS transporter [Jeongeupia sp. HS-3]